MPERFLSRLISIAFPIIVAGSVILLIVYGAVQQDMRQAGNDPQIELAEDAATILSNGYPANALTAAGAPADMSRSLAPFLMVFDASGRLLASSAFNSGPNGPMAPSLPPAGVFGSASMRGEDRVTWQTPSGSRFAAVIAPWGNASSTGFVLVARSIRETEIREDKLGVIVFAGWLLMVLGTVCAVFLSCLVEENWGRC